MIASSMSFTAQDLTLALGGKWNGRTGTARCPAHDDRTPSMSITAGKKQEIVVHCFVCDQKDIVAKLLEMNLWPRSDRPFVPPVLPVPNGNGHHVDPDEPEWPNVTPLRREKSVYPYYDEQGTLLYEKVRFEPKGFTQRQPNGSANLDGVRRVLYRLPHLLAAPEALVWLCEGEKDADALAALGFVATTATEGASKSWSDTLALHWQEYAESLRGRDVVILPDNDDVGYQHAAQIHKALLETTKRVRILALDGLEEKGDVSDWLAAGGTAEQLQALADALGEDPRIFPLSVLPEAFQRYVEHVARLKVCPPEYVAIPLLVSAGTAVGNVVKIRLNSTWIESPQLFAALIGDPGSKKTPATQQGLKPLNRLQSKLSAEHKKKVQQYERELVYWEGLPKKERGPKPDAPEFRHVTVNDVTIEKLADVLAASKGVLLAHDELAAWVRGMDQYRGGKGSDRQHYLSMWSGTNFKVDRKSSPIPVVVENPCLGVIGGIQPEMLGELTDEKNRSDGFLDRILWAYPESIPDYWVDDDGGDSGIDDLGALWERLYDVYGTTDLVGNHVPCMMQLNDEALAVWRRWYNEHARDRDDAKFPKNLAGPWAKMGTQLARITLILHVIQEESTNWISAETLEKAIKLVEYFKAHARKVFEALGEAKSGSDIKVLEALKRHGDMSQNEVRQKVFHGHMPGEKVRSILFELEERGLVNQAELETNGRKATIWSLA